MEKPRARLENWWFGDGDFLYGNAYGKEGIPDGEWVRCSRVVNFNPKTGTVETVNTLYLLGKPASKNPFEGEDFGDPST